jgi:hypothetical protein
MRNEITSEKGFVSYNDGSNSTSIEGREYHEAPFDQRWDDLYAAIDNGTGPAQLTYEGYRDTGFYMRFFRHNQDDAIFMRYQMSHQWDPTTAVSPHMHCVPMASGSGVVKMNYAYSWSMVNGALSGAAGWVSGTVSSSYTPADQYNQRIISFGLISPPATARESAILVFKVERLGASDATDTYQTSKPDGTAAANLAVLFFDVHYQKIKAGTVTQYPEAPTV